MNRLAFATVLLLAVPLAGSAQTPAQATPTQPATRAITTAGIRGHLAFLSDDLLQGRAPGTQGGRLAARYIASQLTLLGLEAPRGGYRQRVGIDTWRPDTARSNVAFVVRGDTIATTWGDDVIMWPGAADTLTTLSADLVFVGYGVRAPEYDWDDYAGRDVRGRLVLILVGDPPAPPTEPELFEGRALTWYGRWTYKFEEAARKGAAAALIIHDTAGASYGWDVVKNSWSGPQFDLRASDDPEPRLPAQGWLSAEAAKQLFADAGQDLDALYQAANQRGFQPVPLDARVSFDLDSTTRESSSRNVIGILRGSEAPDEAVVYMGHWDHLGKHEGEGDQIYNGAIDNATGIAGIIEIAEKFKADGQPKRSVAFIAVTLEESGLLGSKYQVAHPAFPLENTVGVINLDAMSVAGPSRDFVVTGLGNSELEDILKTRAEAQGRTLVMEGNPAGGFYFRSDHFNYAKAGVPALYAKGGDDLVDGGKEAGAEHARRYTEVAYHKPADEFDPAWNLDGVVQDLEALYGVGRVLADEGGWPNWYEGNAFKAARDDMRSGK